MIQCVFVCLILSRNSRPWTENGISLLDKRWYQCEEHIFISMKSDRFIRWTIYVYWNSHRWFLGKESK